eukprot:9228255-Pyramimonas_sp.AAC.1
MCIRDRCTTIAAAAGACAMRAELLVVSTAGRAAAPAWVPHQPARATRLYIPQANACARCKHVARALRTAY